MKKHSSANVIKQPTESKEHFQVLGANIRFGCITAYVP